GEDVALPQARHAGHGIGPRIEPVPDAVDVIDLSLAQSFDRELGQVLTQILEMQHVELDEAAAPAAHALHRRLILLPPGVGELPPIALDRRLALGEIVAEIAHDRAAPIDDRAEHVEGEGFYGSGIEHRVLARHALGSERERVAARILEERHPFLCAGRAEGTGIVAMDAMRRAIERDALA